MKVIRQLLPGGAIVLLLLIVSACGSTAGSGGATPTPTSPPAATATATSTPYTTGDCGRYCATPTPTATTGGSSAGIKTASVSVAGTTETVLTNLQGLTLYYRTSDTSTSVYSGSAWPPLLSSTVPGGLPSLPGKVTVVSNANGSQLAYNGHPLYTYAGDSAAGQANGQGLGGVWFVVTPGLSA